MHPAHTNIADSEVALVAPPELDRASLIGYNDAKRRALVLVAYLLEDDVGAGWFLNSNQLVFTIGVCNLPGERDLADLALQLFPLVGCSIVVHAAHNLVSDPIFEAEEMNASCTSRALAWVEKHTFNVGLVDSLFFHETVPADLLGVLPDLLVDGIVDRIEFVAALYFSDDTVFNARLDLNHPVLYPAKLDYITRVEIVASLGFSITSFEASDDQVNILLPSLVDCFLGFFLHKAYCFWNIDEEAV